MAEAFPAWWHVPRAWVGARCFILAGGESVRAQRHLIPKLRGRIIAIKQSVRLRPDADVLLLDESAAPLLATRQKLLDVFPGREVVVANCYRGVFQDFPARAKRLGRDMDTTTLCSRPGFVTTGDLGIAAISLAYHFGATEIVLLGCDGVGRHWWDATEMPLASTLGETCPSTDHFPHAFAADARRKGLRIVNASPVSVLMCFERQPLETFLDPAEGRKSPADSTSDNASYRTLPEAKVTPAGDPREAA